MKTKTLEQEAVEKHYVELKKELHELGERDKHISKRIKVIREKLAEIVEWDKTQKDYDIPKDSDFDAVGELKKPELTTQEKKK